MIVKFERVIKMAKKKKLTKKIIEKFDKKEIAYLTDCIIEAVLAKFESDPKLQQECLCLCGLVEKEEVVQEKPVKAEKVVKEKAVKAVKKPKTLKKPKVASSDKASKTPKILKIVEELQEPAVKKRAKK